MMYCDICSAQWNVSLAVFLTLTIYRWSTKNFYILSYKSVSYTIFILQTFAQFKESEFKKKRYRINKTWLSWFIVFPYEVYYCSFLVCEELCCNFNVDYIESVCQYFVGQFWIHVHEWDWSVILFLCWAFVWSWYQDNCRII